MNIVIYGGPSQTILNKRPALKKLICRVLKGSERSGQLGQAIQSRDTQGAVAKNSTNPQTRLTPERCAELVADYEAGMAVRMIAAKYGVHRGTIPRLVVRSGTPLRMPGLDDAGRSRATALYAEGLTLQEVAERLAVDEKTVRSAVIAEGGQIRPRGRIPQSTL